MFRPHVIGWIFWRNVKSYFSGVLGYLVIVAFVMVCALLAFSQTFFANNYASLDELSKVYSWLLLFLVPAITMGAWAEEHKSGTDVLLFTLPATPWEILWGKYLSVCAVYTVAVLFSVTQLIALALLGQPDWWVVISTYCGYWLAGLTLLSIGLFASSLTRDAAVAFVLGMLLCAIPVLSNYFLQGVGIVDLLTIQAQIDQFASGVITLTSLFYFGGIIALFLYLNHIVISHRLWARYGSSFMWLNFGIRSLALLTVVVSGFFLLERLSGSFPAYVDATSERLYTLNETTLKAIRDVDAASGKITIEAYISDEVPADYVPVKKQLETLLSQYERLGGGRVELRRVVVRPTTSEATQAIDAGIQPLNVQTVVAGKNVQQDVYLGIVVSNANGETVLPRFSPRNSIEYEITRAIAQLSEKDTRPTIGVLETDLHFAGLDFQGQVIDLGFGRTKSELEKFYRLRRVNASLLRDYVDSLKAKIDPDQAKELDVSEIGELSEERRSELAELKLPNVLMVVGVSSLDNNTLMSLVDYIKFGKPVLLLDDPVPFMWPTYVSAGNIGIVRSPAQPRLDPQAPFSALNASALPKASMRPLEETLGISWTPSRIVWNTLGQPDTFKFPEIEIPMSEPVGWAEGFGSRDRALVSFRNTGSYAAFNSASEVSAGLRELLFVYSGMFEIKSNDHFAAIPLVSTMPNSGYMEYDQYSENFQAAQQFFDRQANRRVVRRMDQINQLTNQPERRFRETGESTLSNEAPLVVAAHFTSETAKSEKKQQPRNVILICDTDFVSDLAYECEKSLKTGLDNLHFLKNAIEELANPEDNSFIEMRRRRPQSRPLVKIEEVRRLAREQRVEQQGKLERELNAKLAEAQKKLDEKTKELDENRDLSFIQRLQLTATAASEEQRRFDKQMEELNTEFDKSINELEVQEKSIIVSQEWWTRLFAVLLPPLPALAIGIFVLVVRLTNQANARRKS